MLTEVIQPLHHQAVNIQLAFIHLRTWGRHWFSQLNNSDCHLKTFTIYKSNYILLSVVSFAHRLTGCVLVSTLSCWSHGSTVCHVLQVPPPAHRISRTCTHIASNDTRTTVAVQWCYWCGVVCARDRVLSPPSVSCSRLSLLCISLAQPPTHPHPSSISLARASHSSVSLELAILLAFASPTITFEL